MCHFLRIIFASVYRGFGGFCGGGGLDRVSAAELPRAGIRGEEDAGGTRAARSRSRWVCS